MEVIDFIVKKNFKASLIKDFPLSYVRYDESFCPQVFLFLKNNKGEYYSVSDSDRAFDIFEKLKNNEDILRDKLSSEDFLFSSKEIQEKFFIKSSNYRWILINKRNLNKKFFLNESKNLIVKELKYQSLADLLKADFNEKIGFIKVNYAHSGRYYKSNISLI